jgi:hypothetical protein
LKCLAATQHFFRSHVLDDAIGDAPPNEIELGDRRCHAVKLDPLRTTKRIKELLRISIQTRLVRDVHGKLATGRCHVRDVLVLGIVGHEPLEVTQRNAVAVTQNIYKLFAVLRDIKKTRQCVK